MVHIVKITASPNEQSVHQSKNTWENSEKFDKLCALSNFGGAFFKIRDMARLSSCGVISMSSTAEISALFVSESNIIYWVQGDKLYSYPLQAFTNSIDSISRVNF